jgi:AsmA protein
MPQLPSGAGRDRIAANGQITLTDAGSVHLRDGHGVTLDDNSWVSRSTWCRAKTVR